MLYTESTNPKLEIAVVGSGYMATKHLEVLQYMSKFQDLNLVGIVGRNESTLEEVSKTFRIKLKSTSLAELLSTSNPSHIIVAVDEDSVTKVCNDLSEFKGAVLFEKPFGLNLSEYKTLNQKLKYRENKFVALNRRFYEESQFVRNKIRLCKSKVLGFFDDQHDIQVAKNMGISPEILSSWHFANAIHMVDLIRFYMRGRPVSVSKKLEYIDGNKKYFSTEIIFDSGDVAIYGSRWNIPGPWRVSIALENTELVQAPLETLLVRSSSSYKYEEWGNSSPVPDYLKKGLYGELMAFLNLSKTLRVDLPTISSIYDTMELVDNIYK
jgi:predicted dehydrogenase